MSSLAMQTALACAVRKLAAGSSPGLAAAAWLGLVWLLAPQLSPASTGVVGLSWAVEQTK